MCYLFDNDVLLIHYLQLIQLSPLSAVSFFWGFNIFGFTKPIGNSIDNFQSSKHRFLLDFFLVRILCSFDVCQN